MAPYDPIETEINKYLSNFGVNPRNEPLFRLVWSTDQLEKRWGDFRDYLGDLFIREVHACREVHKYWFIPDRWVMERWFPPEVIYNEELPESRYGSYEPLYVFDKDQKPLPLKLRVVEIIIDTLLNPPKKNFKSRLEDKSKEKEKLEQEYFDKVIDGSDSGIGLQLHWGEAIIVPKNYGDEIDTIKENL